MTRRAHPEFVHLSPEEYRKVVNRIHVDRHLRKKRIEKLKLKLAELEREEAQDQETLRQPE